MNQGNKRRVAAYCRVSTGKEEQLGSIANQRRFFEKYLSSHADWVCVGIYSDEGKSGTTTNKRIGFSSMLRDCENGLIDTVITKEISRFARNTVDVLGYTRRLKKLGVNVIFLSDGIDTADSDGELRLSIMACIAQEESRKTSDRVKWGQRRQMERGVVFGRDLLGYDVVGGRLSINRSGAEIVRLIFTQFAVEGKSASAIAKSLNESGIPPMRHEKWSSAAILRVLRNEKYVGDLCQGKTFTPDPLDHVKKRQTDNSQLVYIADHHERIISRELWELARARLSAVPAARGGSGCKYWCSGRVVCGKCGKNYVSRKKTLSSGEYLAWRCSSSQRSGGCGCNSVNDRTLLECIAFLLCGHFTGSDRLISEILREMDTVTSSSAQKLEKRIADIRRQKLKLGRKLAAGTITDNDYSELVSALSTELESQQSQLEKLPESENSDRIAAFLRQKLSFSAPDKFICEAVLQQIKVYPDRNIEVSIKGLKSPFRLRFSSSGKGGGFTSEFEYVGHF